MQQKFLVDVLATSATISTFSGEILSNTFISFTEQQQKVSFQNNYRNKRISTGVFTIRAIKSFFVSMN